MDVGALVQRRIHALRDALKTNPPLGDKEFTAGYALAIEDVCDFIEHGKTPRSKPGHPLYNGGAK